MNEELERLARLAAGYRDIGCTVVEVADLMIENHPSLRGVPFNLAQILRSTFGLPVRDLQYINAWLQGEISRETLEESLG
nr:hypothetical protein KitaXyl93_50890 [Kitasatospora sp. Xyl93]